ncbi:MAG: PEP/pyruvate-binding domain-containing protein, partial [Melioribacter sp.]|nr:PEP/pyruvate-binding domain-containing protein [Melioribacter sp.]
IDKIKTPLAVRSSGLLEDAKFEPFAGVYATKMIPNNQQSTDVRFQKLIEAIKFVYASTYFKVSKDYFRISTHNIEEEKMAVIIQEVVGHKYDTRYYPNFSGVARSYNFYSIGKTKPEDGIVNLALGLGKTIVDGGITWSYSPAYPKSSFVFGSPHELLKLTQTDFWAVNLSTIIHYNPVRETEFLIKCNLKDAEYDSTLKLIASTYSYSEDKIIIGTETKGPRIINFTPLLYFNEFRFNDLIKELLKICQDAYNSPVEIEFACTLNPKICKMDLGFLQIRPIAISNEVVEIKDDEMMSDDILIASECVLGNGIKENIFDIVYVKPDSFDKKYTTQIAKEIEIINKKLVKNNLPYLLIGFGRWGSSDPWLGIPVIWSQISGASIIVESTLLNIDVELSQGSHFFHNLLSFNVFYFSINYKGKYKIDWDWLKVQEIVEEKNFVSHVKLKKSILVKVDGKTGKGIIKKC